MVNYSFLFGVYTRVKYATLSRQTVALTSPLTVSATVLLFLIPYIYLHGILARILGHRFAGFLVPNEAPGRSSSLKETEGDEAIPLYSYRK